MTHVWGSDCEELRHLHLWWLWSLFTSKLEKISFLIIFRTPEKTSEIALSIFFYWVIGQTIQSLIQFLNSLVSKGFRLNLNSVQKLDIFFCFITPVTSLRHGKRFLVKCYLERLCYLTLIICNYFSYEIKQAPVVLELILCKFFISFFDI